MRTLVVSDLHLGNGAGHDVLRLAVARDRLLGAVDGIDRLVLLGDAMELMSRRAARSAAIAEPVMRALGRALRGREVIVVPGNHDGPLLHRWALAQGQALSLAADVPASASLVLERLVSWLGPGRTRVSYPGVWLGPRIWATHGHYLDRHLVPESALGLRRGRLGREPTGPARPIEYERARRGRAHRTDSLPRRLLSRPAATVVEGLTGVLRGTALPPIVERPLHGGLARMASGMLDAQMRHAGIPAMAGVVRRLGVEADWVLFGHVHRRGPIAAEPWPDDGATRFVNTGAWLFDPLLVGGAAPPHGYWPGGAVLLEDGAAPRSLGLLDDVAAERLRPVR